MTPAAQRLLSLAAFGLVLLAAILCLVAAGRTWMEGRAELAVAERRAAAPEPVFSPERYLTTAASRAEASVALQGRINSASGAGDVSLNRMRILPEDENTAGVIIAEVEAEGDWTSLTRFIHALEASPPGLIVREMRASADIADPRRPIRLSMRVEARFAPPAPEGDAMPGGAS